MTPTNSFWLVESRSGGHWKPDSDCLANIRLAGRTKFASFVLSATRLKLFACRFVSNTAAFTQSQVKKKNKNKVKLSSWIMSPGFWCFLHILFSLSRVTENQPVRCPHRVRGHGGRKLRQKWTWTSLNLTEYLWVFNFPESRPTWCLSPRHKLGAWSQALLSPNGKLPLIIPGLDASVDGKGGVFPAAAVTWQIRPFPSSVGAGAQGRLRNKGTTSWWWRVWPSGL